MERLAMMLGQFVGGYAPKQAVVTGGVGAAGLVASFMFGGWSQLLIVLVVLVIADYGSGLLAAGAAGELSSSKGFVGIARKVFIFVMVCVAHQIDSALGDQHVLRDATLFFYIANELLSITENCGRIGLPLPPAIKQAVEVLKNKGGAPK